MSLDDLDVADRLKTALWGGDRVVAFVGAGVSMAAGYPDWTTLLNRIHKVLNEVAKSPSSKGPRTLVNQGTRQHLDDNLAKGVDDLWRAEEYRRHAGTDKDFRRILMEVVQGRRKRQTQSAPVARKLIQIPFTHFLTTNYDSCLEDAAEAVKGKPRVDSVNWPSRRTNSAAVLKLMQDSGKRRIFHLHGSLESPATTILTNQDYREFYLTTDRNSKQLFSIFATHRVCFLGFSLTDVHVLRVLEQVNALGQQKPSHFALLPDPGSSLRAVRARMLDHRYGVAPIFYRLSSAGGKNRHAAFATVIDYLHRAPAKTDELGTSTPKKTVAPEPPEKKRSRTPEVVPAASMADAFWPPSKKTGDPDDPNRGRFGKVASRCGLRLDATVKSHRGSSDWFRIHLTVQRDPRVSEPTVQWKDGTVVKFHLHPTFPDDVMTTTVRGGKASLQLIAYGAFTVGVTVGRSSTCLELDLSKLRSASPEFRRR